MLCNVTYEVYITNKLIFFDIRNTNLLCKNVNPWDKNTTLCLYTSTTRVLQKYDTFIIQYIF